MEEPWYDALIFRTVSGSHLYGTATPESDIDVRGVCHQTTESLVGLTGFEQYDAPKPNDETIYGLNKFCKLAAECNPNIVELLFAPTDPSTCLFHSREWDELIELRPAFLSKKAQHTFTGYAFAQLKRIELHHRWLVNPPEEAPYPEDFGAIQKPDGLYSWPSQEAHNAYQNRHSQWKQYLDWLDNRNPVRADLELKWGYDTKHGMHLARLMTQGQELLATGKLILPRPDAKWLLEIRNGLMDYDEICQWANYQQGIMGALAEDSPLPWGPDWTRIEEFVMEVNIKRLRDTGASW